MTVGTPEKRARKGRVLPRAKALALGEQQMAAAKAQEKEQKAVSVDPASKRCEQGEEEEDEEGEEEEEEEGDVWECSHDCGFWSETFAEVAAHEKACPKLKAKLREGGEGGEGGEAKPAPQTPKTRKTRKTGRSPVERPQRPRGSGGSRIEGVPWSARLLIASFVGGAAWLDGCARTSTGLAEGTRWERPDSCELSDPPAPGLASHQNPAPIQRARLSLSLSLSLPIQPARILSLY